MLEFTPIVLLLEYFMQKYFGFLSQNYVLYMQQSCFYGDNNHGLDNFLKF